jgi:exodeoxyribonuclease VII large subunit
MQLFAVSQLTLYLKEVLESDPLLQDIWVQGEISNYSQSSAGHQYFSLKDEGAQLRCVLFRRAGAAHTGRAHLFAPQFVPPPSVVLRNGMAVLARGRLALYESRGEYQLVVGEVEEAGVGLLHLRFEQLKQRLEAEGLFAEERKRPLPRVPGVIGIVTSPQAAALRDMLRVLRTRCPLVRVILAPTLVQGEAAAGQVATAIDRLNTQGEADVIIVARGGGSVEELWAFNEEVVARAIYHSRLPVITGVGHETDFTIADLVADYRASTPTAAAAAAVPDAAEWRRSVADAQERLEASMEGKLELLRGVLNGHRRDLVRASPLGRLTRARQQVDEATRTMSERLDHVLGMRRERLRGAALHLNSLSPLLTMARGYAVVRRASNGETVTSVHQVQAGEEVDIHVRDGHLRSVVWHVAPEDELDEQAETK